jgi:D-serine dehydratase
MQNPSSLRDLYPTLTEQELKEAEANLRRYAEIAVKVFQEQCSRDFDSESLSVTMKERSNKSLKN